MKRRGVLIVLLACFSLGANSCGPPAWPTDLDEIPIKVWIVLGAFDTVVGNTWNMGCRLNRVQISERIHHHIDKAEVLFGPKILFTWDGSDTVIPDPLLIPFPGGFYNRTRDPLSWDLTILPLYWQPGHLNIYFVGNFQLAGSLPDDAFAFTLDKRDASGNIVPDRPNIIMNDTGWGDLAGMEFQPIVITLWNILEHEVTHFLGDFDNTCFPGATPAPCPAGTREYDDEEHSTSPYNILNGINNCSPLYLPGHWTLSSTEQGQIWQTIQLGGWQ